MTYLSAKIDASFIFPSLVIVRAPLDWLEERTTGMADRVLVNSRFTAAVFRRTFRSLRDSVEPEVLHPSLDTRKFDTYAEVVDAEPFPEFTFLSINRYERKKNLPLAIKAFGETLKQDKGSLRSHLPDIFSLQPN